MDPPRSRYSTGELLMWEHPDSTSQSMCMATQLSKESTYGAPCVNFQVYNNNTNDPKDYGGEDICNHCGIKEKNKTLLLFFLVLSSGHIIRNQIKDGKTKKLRKGARLQ